MTDLFKTDFNKRMKGIEALEEILLKARPEFKNKIKEFKNEYSIKDYLDRVSFMFDYEDYIKINLRIYNIEEKKVKT